MNSSSLTCRASVRTDHHGLKASSYHTSVAILLLVQLLALGYVATVLAPNPDEFPNIVAGLSYLKTGDYSLYSVNPPALKIITALPALSMGLEIPTIELKTVRPEFDTGLNFWRTYGAKAELALVYARWIVVAFTALGTLAIYRLGCLLRSPAVGLGGALFWAASPLVLAYGAYNNSDTASCSVAVLATTGVLRWLRKPSLLSIMEAGMTTGLALAVKTMWVLLLVLWPLTLLCNQLWVSVRGSGVPFPGRTKGILAILFLAVLYLNFTYRFEGFLNPLGSYQFASRTLKGPENLQEYGNVFRDSLIAVVPMPFPKAWVVGIDVQRKDFEFDRPAYRFGKWQVKGVWYYYLLGLAVKLPLGFIFLLGIGLGSVWKRREEAVALLLIPAFVLCFISSQTGLNEHFRYAISILGFLALLAAVGFDRLHAWTLRREHPFFGLLGWIVLLSTVVSAAAAPVTCFPYCNSYGNEISGGSERTAELLGGSAGDWYQGWWAAQRWLDERSSSNRGAETIVHICRWTNPLFSRRTDGQIIADLDNLPLKDAKQAVWLLISRIQRQAMDEKGEWKGWFGEPALVLGGGVEVYDTNAATLKKCGMKREVFYLIDN